MLPRHSRLNLKKDYKRIAAGKRLESPLLTLIIKFSENEKALIGIASSVKTFKKAVDRNRARRLTSWAFESLYTRLPSKINIIALPKAHMIDVKSSNVLKDLEKILKNEKIIN